MAERTIKFRGVSRGLGKLVYGSLLIRPEAKYSHCIYDGEKFIPVVARTVVQMIGYDADGAEVYEGDGLEYKGVRFAFGAQMAQIKNIPKYRLADTVRDLSFIKRFVAERLVVGKGGRTSRLEVEKRLKADYPSEVYGITNDVLRAMLLEQITGQGGEFICERSRRYVYKNVRLKEDWAICERLNSGE